MSDDDARRAACAVALFRAARRVRGTAGAFYLAMRGLRLPDELEGAVVRFHPACPRQGARMPALIVLMRGVLDDEPRAVQRIFIGRDYAKAGKPMMLGLAGGAAMKLGRAGDRLHVCEGFETGLALIAQGHAPVWALGSAGGIARLPIVAGVRELVICADNDASWTGKKAAAAAMMTWGERACAITVDRVGADFADIARETMGRL